MRNKMQDAVRKTYRVETRDVDREKRTLIADVSTDDPDRDHEVILPSGIRLDSFRKNPVIMFGHKIGADGEPSDVIGRSLWIKPTAHTLRTKIQFAKHPKAQEVFDLYEGQFLNAWSIQFIPLTHRDKPTPVELAAHPNWQGADIKRVHTSVELLEASAVPVPSCPTALSLAISKGLCVPAEVKSELERERERGKVIVLRQPKSKPTVTPVVDVTPAKTPVVKSLTPLLNPPDEHRLFLLSWGSPDSDLLARLTLGARYAWRSMSSVRDKLRLRFGRSGRVAQIEIVSRFHSDATAPGGRTLAAWLKGEDGEVIIHLRRSMVKLLPRRLLAGLIVHELDHIVIEKAAEFKRYSTAEVEKFVSEDLGKFGFDEKQLDAWLDENERLISGYERRHR